MIETFGARLRRQREEQHIALATIAERTKIKASLLDALEHDDVSHWPTGIFRRAFIRAYAEAVRLDPSTITREFLAVYPDPAAPPPETGPGAAEPPVPGHGLRFGAIRTALGSLRRGHAAAPIRTSAPPETGADSDPHPKFCALARVCTELGRASTVEDAQAPLGDAADLLDATGVIVWEWDERDAALKPRLAYGYSQKVLQQIPAVPRDASNITAAAFRSAEPQTMHANESDRGAIVVPLMARGGCTGVLAIELRHGLEDTSTTRTVATIIAALLAPLVQRSHALTTKSA